jgi:hypothetical protein
MPYSIVTHNAGYLLRADPDTMLVAGGGLCVGVSRAALKAPGAALGDDVEMSIAPATAAG